MPIKLTSYNEGLSGTPALEAFMCYARIDDHDGILTQFRDQLSKEVQRQTGQEFPIFQDINSIGLGQPFREQIGKSLSKVTFVLAILTPSFFNRPDCRDELQQFLKHELELGRNDLILPVYWTAHRPLEEARLATGVAQTDELLHVLSQRQLADLRKLRHLKSTSLTFKKGVSELATKITAVQSCPLEKGIVGHKRGATPSAEVRRAPTNSRSVSPSQSNPTPPLTLIVDHTGSGDFTSIADAVRTSGQGDQILVRPGKYREALVVDKDIEIIGTGVRGNIVVEVQDSNAVSFHSKWGRVANLTVRQLGRGNWYGVDISDGWLEMVDCDITSEGLGGVAIRDEADPRLLRNRIHDCSCDGVSVFGSGRGTLEENDIFNNREAGILITSGGDPTLCGNRIYHGQSAGIAVRDAGRGLAEDNDIFQNELPGVLIESDGNPIIRHNQIHHGRDDGVLIRNGGRGRIEKNDIYKNRLAGVAIADRGDALVRLNRIHNGYAHGIIVYNHGRGQIEDNEICANRDYGVEMRDSDQSNLVSNQIYAGQAGGVLVWIKSQPTLEENNIHGNAKPGLVIKKGADPLVRRNRIHNGESSGVHVLDDGLGRIENNDIFENALAGLAISENGNPCVIHNRIYNGQELGVAIFAGGCGVLDRNHVHGNQEHGVEIRERCNPTLRYNRINHNGGTGVRAHGGTGGIVEDNDLLDNLGGPSDRSRGGKLEWNRNLE